LLAPREEGRVDADRVGQGPWLIATSAAARRPHKPRRLAARGWQVVRATWVDLDERPAELAADLWALLRAQGL
jgi:hypothetical protein